MFPRVERSGNGIAGATAALIVLAAAAGCSSSSSSSSSTPANSSSSTGAAAPASGSAPATTPATTGPSPCATSDLTVSLGPSNGAAGSVYQTIVFTNHSSTTCTLYGFAGVSLVTAPPYTQIGLAAQRGGTTPLKLITLPSGAIASAALRIVDALNFGSATCGPTKAAFLRVYPPNQTVPVYLADASEICAQPVQTLFISAVQAGSGAS